MARWRIPTAVIAAASIVTVPAVLSWSGSALAAQKSGSGGKSGAVTHMKATKVGTFTFPKAGSSAGGGALPEAPPHQPMNKTLHHAAASQVPSAAGAVVNSSAGGASGFNGLDAYQQATAGSGSYANSQYDVTPPDQALCVGNGQVLEAVNLAAAVYNTDGSLASDVMPLNQVFDLAPESANGGPPFGPSLSDPKCYYDPGTGYWFLSALEFAVDPATGAFGNSALQYVAVSKNALGTWSIYDFPTTDDGTGGTPSDPGCPCFGDQPLIGADANGFYVTTNEYSISGPEYNGAQVYAMSKTGLETGDNTTVTHLQPGMDSSVTSTLGGVAFSIQPATSPDGGYAAASGGTEYFQSALDFGAAPALGTRATSIAVWALTNTSSLNTSKPQVALSEVVVPSEAYAQPPNAYQAPGTLVISKKLPLLDANDDRMNQVVYAGGHLWSGLNTAVSTPQGPINAGIAWFSTTPSMAGGNLSAEMAGQGYLAVTKEDVIYPSIGVTPAGNAVMAFTLAGPDYHPSAAWAPLSLTGGAGPIYVAAPGQNAADDFSAVKAYGGTGSIRWGDYSAAVSDTNGTVWMGTEYISGQEQTNFANWATYIAHVKP